MPSGLSTLQKGWAIKQDNKTTRFNENQKSYLFEKFGIGTNNWQKREHSTCIRRHEESRNRKCC